MVDFQIPILFRMTYPDQSALYLRRFKALGAFPPPPQNPTTTLLSAERTLALRRIVI